MHLLAPSSRETNPERARMYAREFYSRQWLAAYLCKLEHTTEHHQARRINHLVRDNGHIALVELLREMHDSDPGDAVIHGALMAETDALEKSAAMLRGWSYEIVGDVEPCAEILEHGRAA